MTEDEEADDIEKEVSKLVSATIKKKNEILIAKENEFHYQHGERWVHLDSESGSRNEGTFAEQSAESAIPASGFINNDAEIIVDFVHDMSEKLHGTFARSVYSTIGDAAERVGNSIHFKKPPGLNEEERGRLIRQRLSEMFERIELSVDQYGAVTYPSLHIHPSDKEMISAISLPETEDERRQTYETQRRKEAEAVGREAARLAKFVRRQ